MDLSNFAHLVDTIGAALSVLGVLVTGAGVVWAAFRKRIQSWWAPYRMAVDNMSQIPAISEAVDKARGEVAGVNRAVTMLTLTMRARADNNVSAAEFECDVHGANTYVNTTYARWLGVGKVELLGWNWVNFLHPDDIGRVRKEWDRCRAEHRAYRQKHRMLTPDGEVIHVETLCTPIPDAPPAHCWIGVMRRIDE